MHDAALEEHVSRELIQQGARPDRTHALFLGSRGQQHGRLCGIDDFGTSSEWARPHQHTRKPRQTPSGMGRRPSVRIRPRRSPNPPNAAE